MKHADPGLKRDITFVLGTFAKDQVVWPLYEIMIASSEDEQSRHNASIQLSVIGPFLKDPQALVDRLLKDVESSDPERRLHAAFAIGWAGNFQAATALIARLYDSDRRVQQTAVNALCNLRDQKIFDLLIDRLHHGPLEQKSAILYNLWRFDSQGERTKEIYFEYLQHDEPDIRFDAWVCLGRVIDARDYPEIYRHCLKDSDPRMRDLALKRLADEAGANVVHLLQSEIQVLLDDPHMQIKKKALALLQRK
jgi:HEAT repeat protein